MLHDLTTKVAEMDSRIPPAAGATEAREQEQVVEQLEEQESDTESEAESLAEEATPSKRITPKSLRKNVQIMAQAAERLAEIAGEDSDSEDLPNLPRGRQKGKRSGSVLVATDIIEKRIDWPHLYIKRKVAGKSKGVAFEDMRMEEFVYGLVLMLKLPAANSIGMLCWMFWRWL